MKSHHLLAVAAALLASSSAPAQGPARPPHLVIDNAAGKPPKADPVRTAPADPVAVSDAAVTYNSEASKLFATKVQPVLSNLCASCHAAKGHAGGFKLRPIEEGYVDPAAVEHNLRAAAAAVTRTDPAASPLLELAVRAHGTAKEPPLRRDQPAFAPLELWVHWASLPEGSPPPTVRVKPTITLKAPPAGSPVVPAATTSTPNPKPTTEAPAPPAKSDGATHLQIGPKADAPAEPGRLPPLTAEKPAKKPAAGFAAGPSAADKPDPTKPNPADPFDPAQFNQLARPPMK